MGYYEHAGKRAGRRQGLGEYQGHKNWAYWNVALFIYNERDIYFAMREIRKNHTLDETARLLLEYLPEKTPDGAKYNYSNVRAALEGEEK